MPSYAERGNVWARQVCEVLGLDPNRVQSIHIDAAPQDVLTVTVVMLANAEELEEARRALLVHVREIRLSTVVLETSLEIRPMPWPAQGPMAAARPPRAMASGPPKAMDTTSVTDEWEAHR